MQFVIVVVAFYMGNLLDYYVFERPVFDSPAKCQEVLLANEATLHQWVPDHILENVPGLEKDGLDISFGCQPKPPRAPGQGI